MNYKQQQNRLMQSDSVSVEHIITLNMELLFHSLLFVFEDVFVYVNHPHNFEKHGFIMEFLRIREETAFNLYICVSFM